MFKTDLNREQNLIKQYVNNITNLNRHMMPAYALKVLDTLSDDGKRVCEVQYLALNNTGCSFLE